MNAFHSIITKFILYDLGYDIWETIMVFDLVSKTPYMIWEVVANIQPKNFKTAA